MIRQLMIGTVVVACVGTTALAVQQATLVLTDGQTRSGAIGVDRSSGTAIARGTFALASAWGGEQYVPVEQVALIDFAGTPVEASELRTLPADAQMHLLVMRNGAIEEGHLVNLVGGDTVRWEGRWGQNRDIPVDQVSRIYLQPDKALGLIRSGDLVAGDAAVGQARPRQRARQTAERTVVQVPGDQPWISTGVFVTQGEMVSFLASGEISWAPNGHTAGPDGNPEVYRQTYPFPKLPVGGLIARVDGSDVFPVGTNKDPLAMPATGELQLGVNDERFDDNDGTFRVEITPHP